MNQTSTIFNHLTKYGSITQAEALEQYGIARLASRISDLRSIGIPVERDMVSGKNRFGEKVHFAKYYLKGKDNA